MKTICAMREIIKAITRFEASFEEVHQLSLNEAIVLCALQNAGEKVAATVLSRQTELSPSHASKVLRSLEEKQLIVRSVGDLDKRQMYFHLTPAGEQRIKALDAEKTEIPQLLQPLFERLTNQNP